jgi:peptide/nickel transport system substrate-binding protein
MGVSAEGERIMKTKTIVAELVMLLVVLAAFSMVPSNAKAAQEGETLYLAMQQDMPDFNTWNLASNSVWKQNVIGFAFESLAGLDFNMLPYELLAEDWTFDEDTLEVVITLREGVLFHNGEEMTADDVVFTYVHAREGGTYASNIINAFDDDGDGTVSLAEIQAAVVKVDDYTVSMTMATPYGQFFTNTLGIPIVPMSVWEDHTNEDQTFDTLWNNPDATIGTGSFYYKEGQDNTYRVMQRFDDYWGKEFLTPAGYSNYPLNVETLYYKIYASIDTAILALQSGAVDHIAWAVTAGRVPSLQGDPNIGLDYLDDNGYFYLAFNQKLEPMNDIDFRQATSYLIDKDTIVNIYMGGFGSAGSAALPPYWGEWQNASVEAYPYDNPFDATTTIPEDMLDAAGFADVNGDGWRDLPDGSPMEKLIILTPPADYDPIRIRAGQMIAKNLREVGINAEAKAIDFDTLVARLQSMDFQMLIIGWSLASDPVANVFDILGPKSNSNTFGFWAEDDPNPFYVDLLGVNTLADEETQELAREVDRLGILARSSFLVEDQMLYTKWAQGVLAEALPCNVLYYRVNVLAYRTSWTGWTPWLGTIFSDSPNIFSVALLEKASSSGTSGVVAESVNAAISMPGKVSMDGMVAGQVIAMNNEGGPVAGATVALTVAKVGGGTASVTAAPATGTTSSTGVFNFNVTGSALGYSFVNVTVTSGGVTSSDSATINCVEEFPATLYLSVTPDALVLMPGETTDVLLMVVDENGDPVEDAEVTIDPNLVGYGSVDVESVMTNETGVAMMVYSAPATIPEKNTHLTLTLSCAVAKDGYAWTNGAAATILVYNDEMPDWVLARVVDVTTTALDSASNSTTITVEAVDDEGNALADHTMQVSYGNEDIVFDPVMEVITDGAGEATVSVQVKSGTASCGLRVSILNETVLNSAAATVTLTYVGAVAPAMTLYGGYVAWDTPQYIGPLEEITATAYFWDHNGDVADGINSTMLLSGTEYGSLVWSDDINWDSLWDYLGIAISTTGDDGNFVTSGPMMTWFDYDNWVVHNTYDDGDWWLYWEWGDMYGVDIVDGEYTFSVYGVGVAAADLMSNVYFVPEGYGYFNETSLSYQIDGATTISSEFVIGRSYSVVASNFEIDDPVMTAKVGGYDYTAVTGVVTDETNSPVENADLSVYENGMLGNSNYDVIPGTVATDADGMASTTIVAIGAGDAVAPASVKVPLYVNPSIEGAVSLFAQTEIYIYTQQAFVAFDPIVDIAEIGSLVTVTAYVTDYNGDPIANIEVELTSTAGSIANPIQSTNSDGAVTFVLDTGGISLAKGAFIPLQAKAGGPGYDVALAKMTVAAMNAAPSIDVGYPVADAVDVDGSNVVVAGSVYDSNGIQSVKISVDGGTAETLTGTAGGMSWNIALVVGELADGEHTVSVNATDSLGVFSKMDVTFTTVMPDTGGGDADMLAWGIAIVGWVVAAAVIVLMLVKKPKEPRPSGMVLPETESIGSPAETLAKE